MPTEHQTIIDLEKKFWQAMVDNDTDGAMALLSEPALMVSSYGAIKFDRAGYREIAEQAPMVITSFEMSDMDIVFPNETTAIVTYRVRQVIAPRNSGETTEQEMNDSSTWIRTGGQWRCVMHTETPVQATSMH